MNAHEEIRAAHAAGTEALAQLAELLATQQQQLNTTPRPAPKATNRRRITRWETAR